MSPTGRSFVSATGTVSWLRRASEPRPSRTGRTEAAASRETRSVPERVGHDGHEHEEQAPLGDAPPVGQDVAHLGLVGALGRGVVGLGALPRELAVDDPDHADEEVPEVVVLGAARVERVDQRSVGGGRRQGLEDLAPVDLDHQVDDDDDEDGVDEDALEEVGDHDRDLAAGEDEVERDPEEDDHDQGERRDLEAEDADRLRQAAEVDEEAGADGREDAEVDDARDEGQGPGEDAEGPAVADLEELGHGQAAGLPEAVEDPARDADADDDDGHDHLPPAHVEAGDVVHLEHADDGDGAEGGRALGQADEVAPAGAAGGQEVGDAPHERLAHDDDGDDEGEDDGDDRPVDPGQVHGRDSILNRGRNSNPRYRRKGQGAYPKNGSAGGSPHPPGGGRGPGPLNGIIEPLQRPGGIGLEPKPDGDATGQDPFWDERPGLTRQSGDTSF